MPIRPPGEVSRIACICCAISRASIACVPTRCRTCSADLSARLQLIDGKSGDIAGLTAQAAETRKAYLAAAGVLTQARPEGREGPGCRGHARNWRR